MRGSWLLRLLVVTHACLTVCAGISQCSAQTALQNPYSATLKMYGVYSIRASASNRDNVALERERIPEVRVTGRIRGEGNLDARFSLRRNKTWTSTINKDGRSIEDAVVPVLLQGKLALGHGWRTKGQHVFPAAAAIIGNELKLSFPGRVPVGRKSKQRIYTVKMALDGSVSVQAHVASIPVFIAKRGACGANVAETAAEAYGNAEVGEPFVESMVDAAPTPYTSNTQQARIVAISTDADPEWYAKYGENSNAVIASIINAAEAMYDRQLGIRFRIVAQHVYASKSPYVSTDPGHLLTEFVTNPENALNLGVSTSSYRSDVDLSHLFTGKDIDGSVVGIAYIGVLCASPALSYGVTQSYLDVAMPGIFAHEVGHNFGAQHDTTDRSGLMYPSISVPPSSYFSEATLAQINSQLTQNPGCLSTEVVESKTYDSTRPLFPSPDGGTEIKPLPTAVPAPAPPSVSFVTLQKQRIGERSDPVVRLYGMLESDDGGGVPNTDIQLVAAGRVVAKGVSDDVGGFEFFLQVVIPAHQRISVFVKTVEQGQRSSSVSLKRTVPNPTRYAAKNWQSIR